MDTDGALNLNGMDEAHDVMDAQAAVAADMPSVANSEKEATVCDIIDAVIDAALSSSVLGNHREEAGASDPSVNCRAVSESQRDDSLSEVDVSGRPGNVDGVETDASPCDDTTDSKAVSAEVVSASAENRGDAGSSSSSSTSSTSSPSTDESDQFGGYTVNLVDSGSDDSEQRRESTADTTSAAAEAGHTRTSREERARRKRQRSFLRTSSSSDSPTSSSSSEAESDIEAKTSRLDVCEEGFQLPADSWKPMKEVVERQYGRLRGRPRNPVIFSQRAGGSVALANRLTLYAKHEVHEGCVNALHFNESGQWFDR